MNQLSPDEDFGKRVRLAAAEFGSTDNLPPLRSYLSLSGNPVASWFNGSIQEIHNLDQVLACAKRDADTSQRAICVIENISWDWLCTIGNAWDIEPIFFAGHGVNPTGDDAWLTLFPKHRESPTVPPAPSRHKYVDGVFEYHYLAKDSMAEEEIRRGILRSSYRRRCWIPKSSYSPSCSTRMSYCRVNANLYLFLVDPPLYPASYDTRTWDDKTTASSQEDRMKTALQLQCNTTGDGIAIPQLLKRKVFSLRQALQKVFRHNWHSHILFDQCDYAISRGELLHLMTASLHQSNFTAIHEEVKSISFHELRKPNMSTNTKLLNLREALADLSASTGVTSKYVPRHVRVFYKDLYNRNSGLKDHLGFQSPVDRLITIKREARDLERFLMDSFQLLMSSISVLETQRGAEQALISIEQAARTTRLTQLAFVYVPLTFVTSIFGMNVKEISEPLPPLWVCFVTLAVVAAGTAALLGGIELFIIKKKTTGDNWAAKGNLMLSPNSSANQVGDLQQARGKIDY